MTKQPMVQESFRLTPANSAKLESLKQSLGITKGEIINQLIAEYEMEGN